MTTLEKRVRNLEEIVRKNFNNIGPKIAKFNAKTDENSSCGGYIYLYCGHCSRSLGSFSEGKPQDLNYCQQCGTKIIFGKDFNKAIRQIKRAKEIYNKVQPLKQEIEDLKSRKKK